MVTGVEEANGTEDDGIRDYGLAASAIPPELGDLLDLRILELSGSQLLGPLPAGFSCRVSQ